MVKLAYKLFWYEDISLVYWWWKAVWKTQDPMKMKVFMWLILKGKVLTQDNLTKINVIGPIWCCLC